MRTYFARILSGEIRKPGSFSPATIEVLSRLTPDAAQLFQRLCNISCQLGTGQEPSIFAEPFGHPGGNALAPLGFDFTTLSRLADAGLVRPSFDGYHNAAPIVLSMVDFSVASVRVAFDVDLEVAKKHGGTAQLSAVFFTTAGQELRTIVHMTPDPQYVAKLLSWAGERGMTLRNPL